MNAPDRLPRMASNHANRGRRGPYSNPTPKEVREARARANDTKPAAAARIRARLRSWENYETDAGMDNHRPMPPGLFELYLIKTGQPLPDWMTRDYP